MKRVFKIAFKPRNLLPIFVVMVGVSVVIVLNATKSPPEKINKLPRPLALYVEEVIQGPVSLDIFSQGEVNAKRELTLVAQVSGRIVEVDPAFNEGGSVAAGSTLVKIDDTDYQLAIIRAKAEVAAAELAVQRSLADADVARKQLKGDSHTPLAKKIPHIAEAKAKLAAAKAEQKQAEINLKHTSATLPFNSRIRSKLADVGQYVTAGTPLGAVFSTDVAEVRLALTDNQLASLGLPIGYKASETPGPVVDFSAVVAGKLRHWQGNIVRLDAAIDKETRLVYAYAEIKDPYGIAAENADGMPLAIGLYVTAHIEGQQISNAFLLAPEALRSGNKVFLIENNKLRIRDVDVIHKNGDQLVLRNGVAAGDQVVVSPVKIAVEGMSVQAVKKQESAMLLYADRVVSQ